MKMSLKIWGKIDARQWVCQSICGPNGITNLCLAVNYECSFKVNSVICCHYMLLMKLWCHQLAFFGDTRQI